jgi:sulfite reductase (NADPH) flavoprotein alpha-component
MTIREVFPQGSLGIEQWQQVQALTRSLAPEQARWLSGYFAGLDAGLQRGAQQGFPITPIVEAAPAVASRTLTILYGTETGNAAELAKALAASAKESGLATEAVDMASYKPRKLGEEQDLLVIVSTYGEGDPPQPAVGFFEFLEGRRAPRLESLRFAVLALGDSTYEFYCEAGKRIDRRLEELGGQRLAPRVDCDVDYDDAAAAWSGEVLAQLVADRDQAAVAATPAIAAASPTGAAQAYDKRNPFSATILDAIRIVGRHSSKETRHVEIDLGGSGIAYEPGDALGVVVRNDPALVAAVLDAAGLPADAPLTVKQQATTLGEALESHFEITASTPRLLDHWAKLSGSEQLEALRGEGVSAERAKWLYNHHLIDVVRQFPVTGLDAETFVAGLRPLQSRLYSIASSLAASPDEAHLTIAPVRYDLHGEARSGVASSHIADRCETGDTLPVYVQSNPHFRLPGDDVPIVMIGAGTGVAPYRAFLQEREARGAGGRSWLFFGERNFRSDFLYQTEWQRYLEDGLLTRMDVAFSRDKGTKTYVQHRMAERAADLYAWLEEGAHLYVCGDAAAMAPDVHETLIALVAEQGGKSREAAEDYVRALQGDHRYQRDVY